jgi:integrase
MGEGRGMYQVSRPSPSIERKSMSEAPTNKPARRTRRRDFGTVISVGSAAEPRFCIRWFEGTRRRQESGFVTRKAAQERLAKVRAELAEGGPAKRRAEATFDGVAQRWLELHSQQLRSHSHNVERYGKHVKPRLGHLLVSAITAEKVLEFRSDLLRHAGLQASTVNRVLALLRTILKFAAVHDYIIASPTDRMARGTFMLPIEKKRREPPIPNPADVGRLLEHLKATRPQHFACFATALLCGLRKGELAGIRWTDVFLDKGFLLVRRSYLSPTKSRKERTCPIPEQLRGILAEHRLRHGTGGELVFPTAAGAMMTPNTRLHEVIGDAAEEIGLPRIGAHACRHQYASSYLAAGGNVSDLQVNLGHSNIATTMIYSHVADAHRLQEAQRLRFDAPKAGLAVAKGSEE